MVKKKDFVEEVKEGAKKVAEKTKEIAEDIIENTEESVKEVVEKGKEALEKIKEEIAKKPSKKKESSKEKLPKEELAKAEKESTEKTIEEKKKAILEKAEKLKEKIKEPTTEELKEKVKGKKKEKMLLPLEEYVKAGIYLGTGVVTPKMRKYVYRRRADGLAIFNTDIIDEKLKKGVEYLSKFNPEDVIVACKRPAGWHAAKMFSEITGIRVFTKKYPAGILTNTMLPDFFEAELAIIFDSWLDKNALNDMMKTHKKILMICDTNNFPTGADEIVIGNNKSPKSLGLIFYLFAKEYCKARGIDKKIPDIEIWTEGSDEESVKQKIKDAEKKVEWGV